MQHDYPDPDRIIRASEVVRLVGLCQMQISRLERRGLFPARFKIAPDGGKQGAVGWKLSAIRQWIDGRAASADKPPRAA